jgi:hypothetical protein
MPFRHVVVDGSNIATEGRSTPSLEQLDEAVVAFQREFPDLESVTVVVDASFPNRIDKGEVARFEDARAHGEVVSPPAGAIGRGDAFLLRIAEKSGATVLSNDSFQEFHGEHEWLFDKDRLIGGVPVPGVGWIFTPRTPVRGPRSREAVREAKRSRVRVGSKEASQPMPVPKTPPPKRRRRRRAAEESVEEAIAVATEEAVEPAPAEAEARRRRRRRVGPPPQAVNDPLTFIRFVADHPLGSELEGQVDAFTSHGAFVLVGGARCYVPLAGLGDPPPRSARQVLRKGDDRTFVLQALDPQRRGIELALPPFAHVSGAPREETVEAEIARAAEEAAPPPAPAPGRKAAKARRPSARAAAKKTGPPAKKAAPAKKAPAGADGAAPAKAGASAKKAKKATKATKAGPAATTKKAAPAAKKAGAAPKKAAPAAKKAAPATTKKKAGAAAKKAGAAAKKAAPAAKKLASGKSASKTATAKKAATAKAAKKEARAGGRKAAT